MIWANSDDVSLMLGDITAKSVADAHGIAKYLCEAFDFYLTEYDVGAFEKGSSDE